MSEQSDLRDACQAFIAAAFAVLIEQHVIPTPVFHHHVAVGRDYVGGSVMPLAEFTALEELLKDRYSERFADPLKRAHPEFTNTYIFSFLEACIARCARAGVYVPDDPAVDESIDELLAVLDSRTHEFVCARHVSHLTSASGDEITIGEVTIVPEPEEHGAFIKRIRREIPGAPRAWNREDPRPYDPPHALLIIRETTDDPDYYAVSRRLSVKLDRFLLTARLLTAGTAQSAYEIRGMTALTAPMNPTMHTFGKGLMDTLIRRTVRLTGDEEPAFAALGALIDAADIKRDKFIATSFDVATNKYDGSHASSGPFEHLVDLATALEGMLIGGENPGEGLTLRLCNRAAALLARDDDPGSVIFDDVKQLYDLRSKLVHGGQITEKAFRAILRKVSTVSDEDAEHRFGLAIRYAVDRMRDLVRRAILARLCLAEQPESEQLPADGTGADSSPTAQPEVLWPFSGAAVDSILADDARRQAWRTRWHDRLDELGAGTAAAPPRPAVDVISQDDR